MKYKVTTVQLVRQYLVYEVESEEPISDDQMLDDLFDQPSHIKVSESRHEKYRDYLVEEDIYRIEKIEAWLSSPLSYNGYHGSLAQRQRQGT